MKKILTLLMVCIALMTPVATMAGDRGNEEMRKEMREFKMKFLAQEMELKGEQQQKFFEAYNAMCDEKLKLFRDARAVEKRVKNDKNATEADYSRAAKAMADAKIKEGEIDRKYNEKFSKFLSAKQIYKMKEAEDTFRAKMREMKKGKK